MTQSKNSKIQTRPIEDLIGRIRALRQQGQKQIVIPAGEADKLADSLTQVMTRMVTIQEEIIEALKLPEKHRPFPLRWTVASSQTKNNLSDRRIWRPF